MRVYTVDFDDGTLCEYAANMIAEYIYVHVDDGSWDYLIMSEIVYYYSDDSAVRKEYKFIT